MLGPILCGLPLSRHPFSLSYGVILPSSLTTLLPSALGFSPHPPVSVYGTGTYHAIAAFLGSVDSGTSLLVFRSASHFILVWRICLPDATLCLHAAFHSAPSLSFCVPAVLIIGGTGISTSCPSTTTFVLALGPDLPRADEPWIFGLEDSHFYLATHSGILTCISSTAPSGTASAPMQRSSTNHTR